jgi:hypothetical protein
MNAITSKQMRQLLERMHQLLELLQEPMRRQLERLLLVLEQALEQRLLFCRKRTKQLQR